MTEAKCTESSSEVSQKLAIGVQKIVDHLKYKWTVEVDLFSKCRDSFKSLGEELSNTLHASIGDLEKVSEQREVIRSNATIIIKPA
ncbi:hypothetical protein PSACC_03481 [Paramicrosporidium saccamoebae]|uniref:Uncharacterized protein n=1 Tax=Paramicrosporidium saccamoebae TaxID=1246581 RepID=A0A2H9TFZ6_9FUNG|nr:hypothetical protein PSACC_03481 [Paramicrosporidium saccamoebae]